MGVQPLALALGREPLIAASVALWVADAALAVADGEGIFVY